MTRDYVAYIEGEKLEVAEMKNPWDYGEWREICREAGIRLVGVGIFDNDIRAHNWFSGLVKC